MAVKQDRTEFENRLENLSLQNIYDRQLPIINNPFDRTATQFNKLINGQLKSSSIQEQQIDLKQETDQQSTKQQLADPQFDKLASINNLPLDTYISNKQTSLNNSPSDALVPAFVQAPLGEPFDRSAIVARTIPVIKVIGDLDDVSVTTLNGKTIRTYKSDSLINSKYEMEKTVKF